MSTRLRLSAVAVLCCLLVACMAPPSPAADAAPPAAKPPAATAAAWQLSVTQSGGFAGIDQKFTATGTSAALVVTDAVRRTEISVALTNAEQQELAQSIAQLASGPDIDLRSTSCRDCYLFDLTLTLGQGGRPRRVRYDSVAEYASPETRLVDRVIAIGRAGMTKASP